VKIIGDGGHAAVVRDLLMGMNFTESYAVIAVGDNAARKREAESLQGYLFASIAHPTAWISPSAQIGAGTVIMAGVVVQANARIGKHVILNTSCSVDHGCVIGDYAHIAPGAHLCGHVEIGDGALVGVGVGIAPGCKIPAWSLVKARRLEIVPLQNHG
jgi:acetyltransferase EpsM